MIAGFAPLVVRQRLFLVAGQRMKISDQQIRLRKLIALVEQGI